VAGWGVPGLRMAVGCVGVCSTRL